jgi:hypothetical protein
MGKHDSFGVAAGGERAIGNWTHKSIRPSESAPIGSSIPRERQATKCTSTPGKDAPRPYSHQTGTPSRSRSLAA